jgi:very-short-patch-repair endonuclease
VAVPPVPVRAAVDFAQRQHGLITRDQCDRLGVPRRTLERRVREGVWLPYGPGVLRMAGTVPSRLLLARAVLLQHQDALVTGAAALELEADGPVPGLGEGPLWLIGPRLNRAQVRMVAHPELVVRRSGGLLLPAPACLYADLIRLLPQDQARDAAHRALQHRKVTAGELLGEAENLRGRAGGRQLVEIAREVASGSHAESELLLHALLQRAGLTGWQANYRVPTASGPRFIDVAFPAAMVALEVDGRAFHTGDAAFETDRARQNELQLLGWRVLRFTWKRLATDPDGVLREILAAVQER